VIAVGSEGYIQYSEPSGCSFPSLRTTLVLYFIGSATGVGMNLDSVMTAVKKRWTDR
jgi:hypothetical protein